MNFATVIFFSIFAVCVSATVRVKEEHALDQSSYTPDDKLIQIKFIGHRRSDDVVAVIKEVDMDFAMQQDAIFTAARAKDMYSVEKDIAGYIKKAFDEKYGPTWQCIVGKDYGSFVTNEKKHFIFFYIGELAFLLFKSV